MYNDGLSTNAKIGWLAFITALLYSIGSVVFVYSQAYPLDRDIDAVEHRAQVAANADDMLGYMLDLKANMEAHDLTHGHTAVIFVTPANDLSLMYESVNRIIDRLQQIKELPKSDTAYQVGLDDLRGTIRELEAPSWDIVWVRYWGLWFLWLIWIWPGIHLLVATINY